MKHFFLFLVFTLPVHNALSQAAKHKFTIYFSTDSHKPNAAELSEIDSLVNYLKSLEKYDVTLKSYCDLRGSATYNQQLATKRASTIQELLTSRHIPVHKIEIIGENYDQKAAKLRAYSQYRKVEIIIQPYIYEPKQTKIQQVDLKTITSEPVKMETDTIKYEKPLTIEQINLEDIKAKKNNLIVLRIEFYPGLTMLTEGSYPELEKLRKFLKENKEIHAFIRGHVCCGSNYPLSLARANLIMHYLIDKGIKSNRLSAKGFDNLIPAVYPETTEEDRQRNRRIDVIFFVPEN